MITRKAYTETYIVLETLDLLKKLPQNVLDAIRSNIIPDYNFSIDKDVPVKFQVTNEDTLSLLSYLYIRFFCDNQEEKNMLKEKINNNEELNKEKRKAEYELAFKKNSCKEQTELNGENKELEGKNLIETKKESFIARIIKRIVSFFKKDK